MIRKIYRDPAVEKELEDYCNDEKNLIRKPADCGGYCDPTLNQEALIDKINSMKLKEEKE